MTEILAAQDTSIGPAGGRKNADVTAWVAVAAGALGAMLATLDISIVNSALPVIQGEIGATGAEGTWIATSFLVAEIVVIPLSAWLERLFGLRTLLIIAVSAFTAFSVLCGIATDLTTMIIGRTGQGFMGGVLIPTAMTIVAKRLPPHQQPIGMALFGMTVVLGPVMGPLIGGWLTENLSWHYAFFVNVPVCAILLLLLFIGLPHEKPKWEYLTDADWAGILGLILGLGGLTVVLEEGHREEWFESSLIRWLTVVTIIGFACLIYGQVKARKPVLKLQLLFNRQFASVAIMALALGMVMYGSTYVIPQFLAIISDYNAFQTGLVIFWMGVPAFLLMPVLPLMIRKVDIRIAVGTGMLLMAISCFVSTSLTAESGGAVFTESQLIRGAGMILAMMFLNQATVASVAKEDAGDASGIFNAARNLGGSFALSALASFQDQRIWHHTRRMEETLNANSVSLQTYLDGLARSLGDMERAMAALGGTLQREAFIMTYNDVFLVMGLLTLATVPLALFLKPLPKNVSFRCTEPEIMRHLLPPLVTIALLAGCTAGPDYAGPPEVVSADTGTRFVRAGSDVSASDPVVAQWWLLLGDPELTRLVEAALSGNPSLAAAQARIAQARASIRQDRAGRMPSLGAQATTVQGRLPGLDLQGGAPPSEQTNSDAETDDSLSFYNVGLNANWELEFAGGSRRRIEASNAQAAATVANAEDAKVQLTAQVASTYVNLREAQFRAEQFEAQISLQEEILALTYQRYQRGALPLFPVGTANAELEMLKSQLAEAEADIAVLSDALAILTGQVPGSVDAALTTAHSIPMPPEQVAIGDPASLVARRPDIRAAERSLAASTARIGVAEAARFPKLSFTGILGLGGSSLDDVVDVGEFSALAIPRLQWNFLDFGRVDAAIDQAGAARNEAVANYQQTVLLALQDAERALARFGQQRVALAASMQIKKQADVAADLNRQRFAAGAISKADLNRALREQQQASADLVRARGALTLAWIALQKSLGLGWQEPVRDQ